MNYISMDIGTSNIKIIETDEKINVKNKVILEKIEPEKALEKFIKEKNINLKNIEKILITGVGANELEDEFFNKPIVNIPEFIATGNIVEQEKFIVASIGTGTAFIKNENGDMDHLGGTGIGGGTLINLCKKINPQISWEDIKNAEFTGKLENVDLTIQDVTTEEIKTLPKDTTAVNFGKLNEKATNEDVILGIMNMIFETIGVMAALAAKGSNITNIITIGQIVNIPYARKVLDKIERLHNVKFTIPKNAEYGTAIGAVRAYNNFEI